MKLPGIKYQILLITLIPVFLLDLAFTYVSFQNNLEQASELLQVQGQAVAREMAGNPELKQLTTHQTEIQRLLDQTIDVGDVVQASAYNNEGKLVAHARSDIYNRQETSSYYYFREAILSQDNRQSNQASTTDIEAVPGQAIGWLHISISPRQLAVTRDRITRDSILLFAIVLLLAIALTSIISARITRPIDNLIEHLKLVETGHLGEIIEPVTNNEIGAMQKGFNQMTQALLSNRNQLNNRIEQATLQLSDANLDMESKNRELGVARDQAQDANRIKSEFLANMSHEIRTPINAIKGFIGLMSRSELSATQHKYADIIVKSTSDLINIVNEILDFTKMESGKLQIVSDEFDLHDVLEQARDILFINILDKEIDLNLIIYSDTPRLVRGDRLRIKQILLNLIGNAIKFTDQGEVVVRVSVAKQTSEAVKVIIRVTDTGIGISEQDQSKLFTAFSQVETAANRQFQGTGLGLVISQNLAQLIGGDLLLKSKPGEGTEFTFELPLSLSPDCGQNSAVFETTDHKALIFSSRTSCLQEIQTLYDRAGITTEAVLIDKSWGTNQIVEHIEQQSHELDCIIFDLRHFEQDLGELINTGARHGWRIVGMHYDRHLITAKGYQNLEFVSVINSSKKLTQVLFKPVDKTPETILTGSAHSPRFQKKVLVVDDNEINLELGREFIQIWGHEVSTATNAEQAMAIYRNQPLDLVFLDIQMPVIDGITLLSMMRDEIADRNTRFIALTANLIDHTPEHLTELGFDHFLSKPINEDKFRSILEEPRAPSLAGLDQIQDNGSNLSIDFDESLALSGENESILVNIFSILLKEIPDYQSQLTKSLSDSDLAKLSEIVHKIHGVTCYISLPRLKKQVMSVQNYLDQESIQQLKDQVNQMIKELDNITIQLDEFFEKLGRTGSQNED